MPRVGRVVLPNYPHHVVQRGHNRQVIFAAEEDYQRYVRDLRELKDAFGIKIYAYCLMTEKRGQIYFFLIEKRGQIYFFPFARETLKKTF